MHPWRFRFLFLPVVFLPVTLCAAVQAAEPPAASFSAIDLDTPTPIDKLTAQLAAKRVVFIGESHDRYDNHLNQLEIIKRLHDADPGIAIGVEYFEKRFQPAVDDYIAGKTTIDQFLRDTDYFEEWGYDYRLYAPIFEYARENKIPVRALNVPTTLVSAVARKGAEGLTTEQRAEMPKQSAPADAAYRARLRAAFDAHGPGQKPEDFEYFVQAQLTWDEAMAESAAAYLDANPGKRMVILAGAAHIAYGSGIPSRLERRTHATEVVIVNNNGGEDIGPHFADYILLSAKQSLPPAGLLGVVLEDKDGECLIKTISPQSAAEKAGLKRGDAIVEIDGQPVKKVADAKVMLWNKTPGEKVSIKARAKHRFGGESARDFEVTLQGAPQMPGPA